MKSNVWYKVLWEQGGFGECSGGRYSTIGGSPGRARKGTLQSEGAAHGRSSEWDRTRPCGEQGLRQEGQEVEQQETVLKGKLGLGAWALDCQAGRLTKENFATG